MNLVGDAAFHSRAYPPVPPEQDQPSPWQDLDETPDPWDIQNQAAMRQLEQATPNSQDLYDRFQKMRQIERKQMEQRNRVDNHDKRRSLDDAIKFVGSCADMCPVYERVRRAFQKNVKDLEKVNGLISPNLAVKAFSRPAAGQPPALPSDVRPPSVLVKTLGYLVDRIVPALPDSHPFLWDRTRSIRQDFTYQNYAGPEAIRCTEIICRIHTLCLHIMIGIPDWSQQQELEQFNKSLRTLDELYALRPNRTLQDCPHEPEMRAFQLLSRIFHAETAHKIESLPEHVVSHPLVQKAFAIRALVHSTSSKPSLYYDFFTIVRDPSTPLLFQILCQIHFPAIRTNLAKALRKSLHKKNQVSSVDRFTDLMAFDTIEETVEFCTKVNIAISDGKVHLETWQEPNGRIEVSKSAFITDHLDFNVLNGVGSVPSIAKVKKLSFAPVPPVATLLPAPTPPISMARAKVAPAPQPVQKIAPSPKPEPERPSAGQIEAASTELLSTAVKQVCQEVAKIATQKLKLQKQKEFRERSLYLARIEQEVLNDILQRIASTAAKQALRAERLQRESLFKLAFSGLRTRAKEAMAKTIARRDKEVADNEFIMGLKDRRAPRLSTPVYMPLSMRESPVPRSPSEASLDEMSLLETENISAAISQAEYAGAKIILLRADWDSTAGRFIKNIFSLESNYEHLFGSVLVTTDSSDRPDITLNLLSHRFPDYIAPQPFGTLGERICSTISAYRPQVKVQEITNESSVDESANISVFLPTKRPATPSLSSVPAKRFSTPRRLRPKTSAGILELQKIINESKELF